MWFPVKIKNEDIRDLGEVFAILLSLSVYYDIYCFIHMISIVVTHNVITQYWHKGTTYSI